MNRIQTVFKTLKRAKRKALIPYLTAGDPNLATTEKLIYALEKSGANLIELGIPFTDSIADGPIIQQAFLRAFAAKTTPSTVLEIVRRVRKHSQIPLCLMTSINIPYRLGLTQFFQAAKHAGVDGFILPDLPQEEFPLVTQLLQKLQLAFIPLVAPTSTKERIQAAARATTGFLYLISRTGTTGVQKKISPDLNRLIATVLPAAKNVPLAVGFGISTPEQAKQIGKQVDGVILGSAVVSMVAQGKNAQAKVKQVGTFICALRKALDSI